MHSNMYCVDPHLSENFNMQKLYRFKEDQPINLPPSEKYTVTPQNDPEQSRYTCQGIRTGRPSYSETSYQFKTKNLREYNRALEVVKSLPWKYCLTSILCFSF